MPTENVFADELENLLAPISEEEPTGPDLRKGERSVSQPYYDVRDARNKASKAERAIREYNLLTDEEKEMELGPPDSPDWRLVRDLATKALTSQTKDLWIAAWLVESLVRLNGFAGVRDGYALIREYCLRYWDAVHPRPDEGEDIRQTFAQLAGLNGEGSDGTLIAPIGQIAITGDDGYSSADYQDAHDLETKDPEIRNQRIAQGMPTRESFDRAVNNTSADFFLTLIDDINGAIDEFDQLTELLDEKCGSDDSGYSLSPPSSNVSSSLKDCLDRVKSIAKAIIPIEEDEDPAEGNEEGENGEVVPAGQAPSGATAVQNREDAFRALLRVADFFRRTEPHSPVSYALEQAVRWGRMPLPELMAELLPDESARKALFMRTGITESEDTE